MFKKLKYFALTAVPSLLTGSVFAEGTGPENPLQEVATTATQYITKGKETVVSILTAGLVIVAAFYIWRLIKKGLGASK